MKARRMVIKGQVQGVGFRWWAARQASSLGLDGSVRNMPDGSVEIVASGQDSSVEQMAALCREGPAGAHVIAVESEVCQAPDEKGFRIARNS
jgi:acylphosphatase